MNFFSITLMKETKEILKNCNVGGNDDDKDQATVYIFGKVFV